VVRVELAVATLEKAEFILAFNAPNYEPIDEKLMFPF
jgi:hypothetical protein